MEKKGLLERQVTCDVTKEKYLPMDQETTQAGHSTRCGHNVQAVFLSHSGKQKNFVRQLYKDLTDHGLSCFFDEGRESLPVGEHFPSNILKAVETCKVAVLLISEDFVESKWPMLELSAFVEARDITHKNSDLQILPLFFQISLSDLKRREKCNEKWERLKISEKMKGKWFEALGTIWGINGINFSKGDNEVKFREDIVKNIRRMLRPSQRYHIPSMQGEKRMCQEVTNFFSKVQPNKKGIRIAGMYGIARHGKTSLGKAFCNLKLTDFEDKVCHLEFSRGYRDDSFERRKLALRYLTSYPQSHLEILTKDEAEIKLNERLKGQKVLLVLDNITEESIDEVRDYIQADFRENSYILLIAQSVDFLVNHFKIDLQSCMHVPSLEKEDAIAILLESTSTEVSELGTEDKAFALKCADRCLFGFPSVRITYHPFALKSLGGYLFKKYGCELSRWDAEIDVSVDQAGYGLDCVFDVLGKAFDDMHPQYRTIFMLLSLYVPTNMSPDKVTEWLAITCNEDISFINKAVGDLCMKAFIEKFEPEISIHSLWIEFALFKAGEMRRWLSWKGDGCSPRGLISKYKAGFELAKLEQCMHRHPSQIRPLPLGNLSLLQLVGVQKMKKLDFRLGGMDRLRNITIENCKDLAAFEGMENFVQLGWLTVREVNPEFKLPNISSFLGLIHLDIDIAKMQPLGDLTDCVQLREINVRCPSLPEFPRLTNLPFLEKVEFSACSEVKGPLDCTNCEMLQSIVLNNCRLMAAPPVLAGCKKLDKIVLSDCDAVTACPDIDEPSALKTLELSISSKAALAPRNLESCDGLENLHPWNMGELKKLPSFNRLSNLIVLTIGKCGIRELPDLTSCLKLENVYLYTLENLEKFPNFSLLRELKIIRLYNCRRVHNPPDISGCPKLQVFHLVCNDNVKGLSKMHECPQLDEIKVSWHCEDEVSYEGIDPDSWEVDDDFQSCLDHFKDEVPLENRNDVCVPIELREWLGMQEKRWMNGRTLLAKKYFRGVKLYCCVMASYESYESSNFYSKNYITQIGR